MTTSKRAAAEAAATLGHATIGGDEVTIQRPNGAKGSRALAELKQAGGAVKRITSELGTFVRDYERDNRVELTRVQAKLRYLPGPVVDEDGKVQVNPDTGEAIMTPHPLAGLTEEDWERAGHVIAMPQSPDTLQIMGHILPIALELMEDRVYRLLALFNMDNGDVKRLRKSGELDAALTERAGELLDELYFDELLPLAVAIAEVIDHNLRRQVDNLGDRLGKATRLLGLGNLATKAKTTDSPEEDTTPSATPETSTPTSSTDTPEPSGGTPTRSSTRRSTSSTASENG